jgi:four helix bundle protein
MSEVNSYKDLLIWQKGMQIAELTYALVSDFPKDEIYSLTNQIKRCSVSIPSNIAEGYGRKSTLSYMQFIKISRGSLFELETQLMLAKRLNFTIDEILFDSVIDLIAEEGKMINSMLNKLKSK